MEARFKNNPAEYYTEQANQAKKEEPSVQNGQDIQVRKKPIETKSRKVFLLMQPTLYDKLKAIADQEELSFNELISMIGQEFLQKRT